MESFYPTKFFIWRRLANFIIACNKVMDFFNFSRTVLVIIDSVDGILKFDRLKLLRGSVSLYCTKKVLLNLLFFWILILRCDHLNQCTILSNFLLLFFFWYSVIMLYEVHGYSFCVCEWNPKLFSNGAVLSFQFFPWTQFGTKQLLLLLALTFWMNFRPQISTSS